MLKQIKNKMVGINLGAVVLRFEQVDPIMEKQVDFTNLHVKMYQKQPASAAVEETKVGPQGMSGGFFVFS